MVMQSSQVSGLIGGQMAMFSNQAAFSQQVGGMVGTSPMPSGVGGMQNPFPNAGSQIVGGLSSGITGAATGLSVAGGLMGGAMGVLDPFTGVSRGFASGMGMSGAGFSQALGGLGSAFKTGGLRGGMGMLAGGVTGAAAASLPSTAIGAGLEMTAGNVFKGAQNVAEVGMMANQYMGPQFGQAGSRDGQMAKETVKRMTGVLHTLAEDDVKASFEELKNVMDKAGRMGMLQGIGDAQQFKQKFSKIVEQVRGVADIMGTTLEEAMPMFSQMRQMGMWSASDVMGTSVSAKVAGSATPQMMQTMQAGAQMSYARGGDLTAGARQGRQAFSLIQAAGRTGSLSEEELMNLTGGVGGAEGQQMVAQQLTNITSRLGDSDVGTLMLAGLGEMEDGTFTGRIDEQKLADFQAGRISVGQLQSMGQKRTSSKNAAMSFFRQKDRMGQRLGAAGGVDVMKRSVEKVMQRGGFKGEEARHQVIQQLFDVGQREAELMGRLFDELPKIQEQQERETAAALESSFRQLRERGEGIEGLKDSLKNAYEKAVGPIQRFGERAATSIGKAIDNATDMVMGRVRDIPMSTRERTRLLQEGALTAAPGMDMERMTGDYFDQGMLGNVNSRIDQLSAGGVGRMAGGALTGAYAGMKVGAALGSFVPVAGTLAGAALGATAGAALGAGAVLFSETEGREADLRNIGASGNETNSQMRAVINQAYKRASGKMNRESLSGPAAEQVDKAKSQLRVMIGSDAKALKELKEKDPKAYARAISKKLSASMGDDFRKLSPQEKLNVIAVAQQEAGIDVSSVGVDFKVNARDVGLPVGTPKELRIEQQKALTALSDELDNGSWFGEDGPTKEDIEKSLTGDSASLIERALTGDTEAMSDLANRAYSSDDKSLQSLSDAIQESKGDPEKMKRLREGVGKFMGARRAMAGAEGRERIAQRAQRIDVKGLTEGVGGAEGEALGSLVRALQGGADQKLEAGEIDTALSTAMGGGKLNKDQVRKLLQGGGDYGKQLVALRQAGAVGVGAGKEDVEKVLEKVEKDTGLAVSADSDKLPPAIRKQLKEILKDGIEDDNELKKFKDIMKNVIGAQTTTEGKKSQNQIMTEQLKLYTEANAKFVQTVSEVLGDKKLQGAYQEVQKKGQAVTDAGKS